MRQERGSLCVALVKGIVQLWNRHHLKPCRIIVRPSQKPDGPTDITHGRNVSHLSCRTTISSARQVTFMCVSVLWGPALLFQISYLPRSKMVRRRDRDDYIVTMHPCIHAPCVGPLFPTHRFMPSSPDYAQSFFPNYILKLFRNSR